MRSSWLPVLAALAVAGCTDKKTETPSGSPPVGMAATAALATRPSGSSGKVLEKLEAGPYSYLRLSNGSGELWAAVPKTDKPVGSQVEVLDPMRMDGFESKTLGRTFDKIVFGRLAPETAAGAMPPGHPPVGTTLPAGHPPIGTPPSGQQ